MSIGFPRPKLGMIDAVRLAKVVADMGLGFVSVDELCDIADEHNLWTDLFREIGLRTLKKTILREVIRHKLKDEDGETIDWRNVIQADPATGKRRRVYKQLSLLDEDDFEYVIRDQRARAGRADAELRRLCKLALRRFGGEYQRRFEFELPTDGDDDGTDEG